VRNARLADGRGAAPPPRHGVVARRPGGGGRHPLREVPRSVSPHPTPTTRVLNRIPGPRSGPVSPPSAPLPPMCLAPDGPPGRVARSLRGPGHGAGGPPPGSLILGGRVGRRGTRARQRRRARRSMPVSAHLLIFWVGVGQILLNTEADTRIPCLTVPHLPGRPWTGPGFHSRRRRRRRPVRPTDARGSQTRSSGRRSLVDSAEQVACGWSGLRGIKTWARRATSVSTSARHSVTGELPPQSISPAQAVGAQDLGLGVTPRAGVRHDSRPADDFHKVRACQFCTHPVTWIPCRGDSGTERRSPQQQQRQSQHRR
jgi:hypothetical protein